MVRIRFHAGQHHPCRQQHKERVEGGGEERQRKPGRAAICVSRGGRRPAARQRLGRTCLFSQLRGWQAGRAASGCERALCAGRRAGTLLRRGARRGRTHGSLPRRWRWHGAVLAVLLLLLLVRAALLVLIVGDRVALQHGGAAKSDAGAA